MSWNVVVVMKGSSSSNELVLTGFATEAAAVAAGLAVTEAKKVNMTGATYTPVPSTADSDKLGRFVECYVKAFEVA